MMPSGLANKIVLPRKQVESALQMYRGQLQMQKEMLTGHVDEAIAWRALVNTIVKNFFNAERTVVTKALERWNQAHQDKAKANEDLFRFGIAELEAKVAITEAQLRQPDSVIAAPPADFKL